MPAPLDIRYTLGGLLRSLPWPNCSLPLRPVPSFTASLSDTDEEAVAIWRLVCSWLPEGITEQPAREESEEHP